MPALVDKALEADLVANACVNTARQSAPAASRAACRTPAWRTRAFS